MQPFNKITFVFLLFILCTSCDSNKKKNDFEHTTERQEDINKAQKNIDDFFGNSNDPKLNEHKEALKKMLEPDAGIDQEKISKMIEENKSSGQNPGMKALLEKFQSGEINDKNATESISALLDNITSNGQNNGGLGDFFKEALADEIANDINASFEESMNGTDMASLFLPQPWDKTVANFNKLLNGESLDKEFTTNVPSKKRAGVVYPKEKYGVVLQISREYRPIHSIDFFEKEALFYENLDLVAIEKNINITPQLAKEIISAKEKTLYKVKRLTKSAKKAKQKFNDLNPTLLFDEDSDHTYIAKERKAIYLPLGKLSFADEVISSNHPGLKKDPNYALGEPDNFATLKNNKNVLIGAYSLGLKGQLTVKFTDNALVNVNGPDLYIFEVGATEPTRLEISKDGEQWIDVGEINGGTAQVDIADFVEDGELYYYVRLTDLDKRSGVPGADIDAIASIGSAIRLQLDSKVLFDTGKSELKAGGKEAVQELVSSIQQLSKGTIIIEGHTDDVGDNNTNKKLSLARANTVANVLKSSLPNQKFKFKTVGRGESKPLLPNTSNENRTKNRRVEILVLPK
ncbi:OmpA family protein [Rasiella rasia]|uniref:OmpA family protein n=1 Tax=Rasiella rasia TaxID=2744027 RepID=A0A6G6GP48_9FLAO|nr:OmpA family protein [Rasiella rasia]QIE60307.1 OmpA family protein [Rasiella rasia]